MRRQWQRSPEYQYQSLPRGCKSFWMTVPGVPTTEMTGYSRVPGVPKVETAEYSRVPVEYQPLEWLEYSRVPGVPSLQCLSTHHEYLEYQPLKWLVLRGTGSLTTFRQLLWIIHMKPFFLPVDIVPGSYCWHVESHLQFNFTHGQTCFRVALATTCTRICTILGMCQVYTLGNSPGVCCKVNEARFSSTYFNTATNRPILYLHGGFAAAGWRLPLIRACPQLPSM